MLRSLTDLSGFCYDIWKGNDNYIKETPGLHVSAVFFGTFWLVIVDLDLLWMEEDCSDEVDA